MRLLLVTQHLKYTNYTSITSSFVRGFAANGIIPDVFDCSFYPNKYLYYIVRQIPHLRKAVLQSINKKLLLHVDKTKPTHLFVSKGMYVLAETLQEIKAKYPDITLSCFNPDDPFNRSSWDGSNHDNILRCIKHYDVYFIWSKALQTKIKQFGEGQVEYLPFAADLELIPKLTSKKTCKNIGFIGNGDKERQTIINKAANILSHQDKREFIHVFGHNWKQQEGVVLNGQVNGEAYFKALASTKVNINILRVQNKNASNMRSFELPAARAFMLHEYSEEVASIFESGKEADYFSSAEELADKALFYLNEDKLREKVAKAGQLKLLKAGHTYKDRVKFILTVLRNDAIR